MTILPQHNVGHYLTTLMKQAGLLAAIATHKLDKNKKFNPILLKPNKDDLFSLEFILDHEMLALVRNHLEHNPRKFPYLFFISDDYAYLPTGRVKALRLEIKSYKTLPFQLVLAIPYEFDQEQLKVYSTIRYCESKLLNTQFEVAMNSFYQGAFDFIRPDNKKSLWKEIYQERQYQFPNENLKSNSFEFTDECFIEAISAYSQQKPLTEDVEYRNPFANFDINKLIKGLPTHYHRYLQVVAPDWLKKDILYQQIEAMPDLYTNGRVVWAAVVSTKDQMFQPHGDNCTGELVFDPYGKTSPQELIKIAQKLKSIEGTEPLGKDQLDYLRSYGHENTRLLNYPCPQSICQTPLRINTMWFWRSHFPNGMISMQCFPILIRGTTYVGEVSLLPAWFWPKALRQKWLAAAESRFGKNYDLSVSIFRALEQTQSIVPGVPFNQLVPTLDEIYSQSLSEKLTSNSVVKIKRPCFESEEPIKESQVKKQIEVIKRKENRKIDWEKWFASFVFLTVLLKLVFELT